MIQPEQTGLLECVAGRFKALADVSRLRLLLALREGPRSVTALQGRLGLAQAAVSKHLGVLRGVGLVESSRHKNRVIYCVADERVFDLCAVVCDGVYRQIQAQQSLLMPPAGRPARRGKAKQGAAV